MNDRATLLEALANLEYMVRQNSEIRGYAGRTTHADIVVVGNGPYDIGFDRDDDDNYECIADWYGAGRSFQTNRNDFMRQVKKEYATVRVINSVVERGYRVRKRYTNETGEEKIVVVKRMWAR